MEQQIFFGVFMTNLFKIKSIYKYTALRLALSFYIFLCTYIILCKVIQHADMYMYSCCCSPFHTYISTTFSQLLGLLAGQSSVVFHCLSIPNAQKTGVLALGTVHLPKRILPYRLLSLRVIGVMFVLMECFHKLVHYRTTPCGIHSPMYSLTFDGIEV